MQLTGAMRLSYVAVAVLVPILTASLIGTVFQLVAIENLGLSASQIGLALGLGAVSIPMQLRAARSPLRHAQFRIRMFVIVLAMLCGVLAWLLHMPISATFVVVIAILVSVIAELAISVLWATSWQPLLSERVSPRFRQRINAQARAVGGVLLIGIVVGMGRLGVNGRTAVLITIGFLGLALLPAIGGLVQSDDRPVTDYRAAQNRRPVTRALSNAGLTPLYLALAVSALPAWPFFLAYSAETFWPTANLGLVAAAVTAGPLAVATLWQPAEQSLLRRAKIGAVVPLLCAAAIITIDRPVSGTAASVATLVAIVAATAAVTVVRMSLLEMAHLRSDSETSVAVLTVLDVVVSTAAQLGFLAAGFLISWSIGSTSLADPYQASLLILALILMVLLLRLDSPRTDGDRE